jgi:hypothetical protein
MIYYKEKIKLLIIMLLFIIIVIIFYYGYNDTKDNYDCIDAIIINKSLETINSLNSGSRIQGLNVFSQKIKYRIGIKYVYKVDNKSYNGTFYPTHNFVEKNETNKIWSKYPINKMIKIYYNKTSPKDSIKAIENVYFGYRYYLYNVFLICFMIIIYFV